jgi:excisionase family DNA binding protein
MPSAPYETLLTTEELAAHLRVSTDTIERMEKAGQLPAPLRNKPVGSGRGRSIKRWDLWRVGRRLDGSDKE